MKDDKFEKKIRGVFSNYEAPVPPNVWTGIAEGVTSTAAAASLTSTRLFKIIGAGVVVIGLGVGSAIAYINWNQNNTVTAATTSSQGESTPAGLEEEKVTSNSQTLVGSPQIEKSPTSENGLMSNSINLNPSNRNLSSNIIEGGSQSTAEDNNQENGHQNNTFQPGGTRTNCVGVEIAFNPPMAQNDVSFLWNFGDGSFSNEREPKHRYLKPGTYVVSLSLSGHKSAQINTMNMSETITILTTPEAEFEWAFVNGPSEAPTVRMENISVRGDHYSWHFEDGIDSKEMEPLKTFSTAGKHAVQVTAVNNNGCKDTKIKYINVNSDYNLDAPTSLYIGEEFMPVGLKALKGNFTLSIYDNGRKIFETRTPKRAWSGVDSKGRNLDANKQYPWIAIVHDDKTGEDRYYSGSILLRP
jgi:PKD repeat protein